MSIPAQKQPDSKEAKQDKQEFGSTASNIPKTPNIIINKRKENAVLVSSFSVSSASSNSSTVTASSSSSSVFANNLQSSKRGLISAENSEEQPKAKKSRCVTDKDSDVEDFDSDEEEQNDFALLSDILEQFKTIDAKTEALKQAARQHLGINAGIFGYEHMGIEEEYDDEEEEYDLEFSDSNLSESEVEKDLEEEIMGFLKENSTDEYKEAILKTVIKSSNIEFVEHWVGIVCEYTMPGDFYDLGKILIANGGEKFIKIFFDYLPAETLLDEVTEGERREKRTGICKIFLDQLSADPKTMVPADTIATLRELFNPSLEHRNHLRYAKDFNGDSELRQLREMFDQDATVDEETKVAASLIGVGVSTCNRYLSKSPYHAFEKTLSEKYFRSNDHYPLTTFVTAEKATYSPDKSLLESSIKKGNGNEAHLGTYHVPLVSLNAEQNVDIDKPKPQLDSISRIDLISTSQEGFYNELLLYKRKICQYIVTHCNKSQQRSVAVGFYNLYPCVMVLIKPKSALPDSVREDWAEIVISYFVGLVNYMAQRNNLDIELVRRSSFGFITPTIAPCGNSFRLNVGIVPTDYADIIVECLQRLNTTLEIVNGDLSNLNTNLPKNCFIYGADYKKYIKESKKEVPSNIKTVLDLMWAKVDKGSKSGARNITRASVARDCFASKVYNEINALSQKVSSTSAISDIQHAQIFLNTLLWACSKLYIEKHKKEDPSKWTLSFNQEEKAEYAPIVKSKVDDVVAIKDEDFFDFISLMLSAMTSKMPDTRLDFISTLDGAIRSNIYATVENISELIEHRTIKNLYYQIELLNELLYCVALFNYSVQAYEEDKFGSDSEGEEEKDTRKNLYYKKVIVQNGMRAVLAPLDAWVGCNRPNDSRKECKLFIHIAYYEIAKAIKLLGNNKIVKRTPNLSEAEVLIHDANACVTNESELVQNSELTLKQLANIKVLIIDATSATTDQCSDWLDKFCQCQNTKVLFFVSSGLKNEQLGADKSPYGTIRVFTKERELREKIISFIKKHEKPISSNVSHHYRRHMKFIGATLRNYSIVNSQKSAQNTNTETSIESGLISQELNLKSLHSSISTTVTPLNPASTSSLSSSSASTSSAPIKELGKSKTQSQITQFFLPASSSIKTLPQEERTIAKGNDSKLS